MKRVYDPHEATPDERTLDVRLFKMTDGRRVAVSGMEILQAGARTEVAKMQLARELAYDAEWGRK